jgi:hypothetical protein
MSQRFRAGTVVKWPHKGGHVYGVVSHLKRTRYSVRALVGDGKHNGRMWDVDPRHMTRVTGKKRVEVLQAQAALALTGKVPTLG